MTFGGLLAQNPYFVVPGLRVDVTAIDLEARQEVATCAPAAAAERLQEHGAAFVAAQERLGERVVAAHQLRCLPALELVVRAIPQSMPTILARPGVLVGVVAMNLARLADGVGTAGIGEADGALRPLGEAGEGV